MTIRIGSGAIGALAIAAVSPGAFAGQSLQITFENTLPSGSFSVTPFWFALHNGGFDSYNGGEPAAGFPGITELAEDGLTGPISAAFSASAAGLAGGVQGTQPGSAFGAPVFSPGESVSLNLEIAAPTVNRWFSYASMVVPTNDLFIATGNPFAHQIFDAAGNFTGPVTILVFGRQVNDNGTEINDAFGGAAFSVNGGVRGDEGGVPIRNFFTGPNDTAYLASFVGTGTVDGGTVTSAFTADDLVARITIVPAPGTAAIGLGALVIAGRRRRARA
jgi:hypothetical protein